MQDRRKIVGRVLKNCKIWSGLADVFTIAEKLLPWAWYFPPFCTFVFVVQIAETIARSFSSFNCLLQGLLFNCTADRGSFQVDHKDRKLYMAAIDAASQRESQAINQPPPVTGRDYHQLVIRTIVTAAAN